MQAKVRLWVVRIVVHAPAYFDVLLAASLLRGDRAIESPHVTLGKCPDMGVHVGKPIGHLLLLPPIDPDETKLAGDNARGLQNELHLLEQWIGRSERAHKRLAGLVEKGFAVVTSSSPGSRLYPPGFLRWSKGADRRSSRSRGRHGDPLAARLPAAIHRRSFREESANGQRARARGRSTWAASRARGEDRTAVSLRNPRSATVGLPSSSARCSSTNSTHCSRLSLQHSQLFSAYHCKPVTASINRGSISGHRISIPVTKARTLISSPSKSQKLA